ncbi:unnamed protein product, partial [Tetraodon nigroviridis]
DMKRAQVSTTRCIHGTRHKPICSSGTRKRPRCNLRCETKDWRFISPPQRTGPSSTQHLVSCRHLLLTSSRKPWTGKALVSIWRRRFSLG